MPKSPDYNPNPKSPGTYFNTGERSASINIIATGGRELAKLWYFLNVCGCKLA